MYAWGWLEGEQGKRQEQEAKKCVGLKEWGERTRKGCRAAGRDEGMAVGGL